MFNLRDFIKKGLLSAIGNMADYQVILNAAGWFEKGVLTEEDLAEINNMIELRDIKQEEVIEEIPEEEKFPEDFMIENEKMESSTSEESEITPETDDTEGEVDSDA